MVQPTQETFDLLPIAWWQNPWYWGVGGLLFLIIIVGLLVISKVNAWRRQQLLVVDPYDALRAALEKLSTAPMTTHAEQQAVYDQLMRLLKEYVHIARQCNCAVACSALTDQECFTLLERHDDAQFLAAVREIEKLSQPVKFAQNVAIPAHVFLSIKEFLAMMPRQ